MTPMEITRPYGLFIDVENIVFATVAKENKMEMNWRACLLGIADSFSGGQSALLKAYGNFSNPVLEFSMYILEKLGAQIEKSKFGKNNTDMRMAADIQSFLEEFSGNADVIILSGDSDYIPIVNKLSTKYFNKARFFVLSAQTSLSKDWIHILGARKIMYLDALYAKKENIEDYGKYVAYKTRENNQDEKIGFLEPGKQDIKIAFLTPGNIENTANTSFNDFNESDVTMSPAPVPSAPKKKAVPLKTDNAVGINAKDIGKQSFKTGSFQLKEDAEELAAYETESIIMTTSEDNELEVLDLILLKWTDGFIPSFKPTAETLSEILGHPYEMISDLINRLIYKRCLHQGMCETRNGKPLKGIMLTPRGFLRLADLKRKKNLQYHDTFSVKDAIIIKETIVPHTTAPEPAPEDNKITEQISVATEVKKSTRKNTPSASDKKKDVTADRAFDKLKNIVG